MWIGKAVNGAVEGPSAAAAALAPSQVVVPRIF